MDYTDPYENAKMAMHDLHAYQMLQQANNSLSGADPDIDLDDDTVSNILEAVVHFIGAIFS